MYVGAPRKVVAGEYGMSLIRVGYFVAVVLVASQGALAAGRGVVKVGESLIDREALTIKGGFGQGINGLSFQQEAVVSHAGYQYVGYYSGRRRVCLARRRLPKGEWETIRFQDYHFRSNDAHNVISIGLCPKDGTIHMAFDHHGHALHYRRSRPGAATKPAKGKWQADLFEPITSELEKGRPIRITYPRFFQTPGGGLQFCYRRGGSGNGDRMLVDYDPADQAWKNTRQIDSRKGTFRDALGQSTSRCSYPNGYTYGPAGRLHVTWVWRETPHDPNHDLCYAWSDDGGRSWRNNAGRRFKGPPGKDSPGLVVARIGRELGLMNTHGQTVDSRGRVHVAMWHCTEATIRAAGSKPGRHCWGPPAARRYHHYWREPDGAWHHRELPWVAGNRPKLFADRRDNLYMIFRATRPAAASAKGFVFPLAGDLVIARATAAGQWQDWKIAHVEKGPFLNEMLADPHRWRSKGVLSILVQSSPPKPHAPTPLRLLDFSPQIP